MGTLLKRRKRKFQRKINESVQTKTGGGFETFLRLDSKRTVDGRYLAMWHAEVRLQSGSTSEIRVEATIDGSQKGHDIKPPNTEWMTFSGFDLSKYNDGDQPIIRLRVRRKGGTDTVEIRNLRIVFERKSD